jgi:cell division protein FtsI (penicillin-binding protein 3)
VRLIQRRIGLLFALFLLLLAVAALRALWLGTVQAGALRERAVSQQTQDLVVPSRRGTITDRHGLELAVSEDAITVFANPFLIDDPVKVAAELSPLIDRPAEDLIELLADRDEGFVYLARKLDAARAAKLEELEIEGIGTVVEPKRRYPQGELAAQLLGAVGTDNYGLYGLEQAREEVLHGQDGKRRLVKDALGEPVSIVESDRAEPGDDLRLTLDAAIQERTEAVLSEVGQAFSPKGATALVLDPRTGAILSLANWPRVDANDIGSAPAWARQNRAVASSYEPGSTFKPFTISGALEEGIIEPETRLEVPLSIQVADRVVGEAHESGNGNLSVSDILARSSNVGTVMIGLKLGAERFDKWVRRFGFGSPTDVGLPGEAGGIILDPDEYSGSSLGNMPIGQGLAVTPMQMAKAYTAIANGGVEREPFVVAGEEKPGRRVLSRKTADRVSKMLEGVFEAGGTAAAAAVEGYTLAGKTGTAEKPDPELGGYSDYKFFSSFVGYAPARNPRLLIAVMVDEPQGAYYGAEVAAPAFQKIVEFALPYLRIPPD